MICFATTHIGHVNKYTFFSLNLPLGVLKKYSNFVGHPVYLNKEQVNELQPLWLLDPKSITKEQYDEFYRFIANTYMKPRFTLHYKVCTSIINPIFIEIGIRLFKYSFAHLMLL